MQIEEISIFHKRTIKDSLSAIDKHGLGVLFIIDQDAKLIGIVTDGDIRRSLIGGFTLESAVAEIMNSNYVALPLTATNSEILERLNSRIKMIPLIDESGVLKDYASIQRLRRIDIASPSLSGNEISYVTECISTNWISSQGPFVRRFEKNFEKYHGRSALAVSNGTVALHLALLSLGIGEGDEVIVPNLTFAASINSVIHAGATPVIVDVEEDTWNIDPNEVRKVISPKTKAIMVVHLYGYPVRMKEICDIKEEHGLLLIEDCAEALGSRYHGLPMGTFGDISTFSFFGNKTITTGEGGMMIFKNDEVADDARVLRDHGMNPQKRYWHDVVGYNYRLTNIQAAIGVAQFERLEEIVERKREIAQKYIDLLLNYPEAVMVLEQPGFHSSYWMFSFYIKENERVNRDGLIKFLAERSIETRPLFYPLNIMPPYQAIKRGGELPVSKYISERGLSLPSSVTLINDEIDYVCNCIEEYFAL
ncbi:MAG: aminotransferase class I/II-fold pyridoxal phosphate-dependent enzyme [Cyclobacteriaceae bacterium]